MTKTKKILIIQRVITSYRLELLKGLCQYFEEVGIVTSSGEEKGTLKRANYSNLDIQNLKIHELNSFKIGYTGESRSTSLFFYPSVIKFLNSYDILIVEGTTNIINNSYIIPIAKILRKKIVWWDSGYSPNTRTFRRKVIDTAIKPLVKLTDRQMAYSTKGEKYIRSYMGGKNAFTNLNTIDTNYFEGIRGEVESSILNYSFNPKKIKLLYVGVVEKRKKIQELVDHVIRLNSSNPDKFYSLDVVGGGNQLDELKLNYQEKYITFHGPIYDKEELKQYYFKSDLFVLPGDGGLAILQSLLYGLPVLCLYGADGTEEDYIKDPEFLLKTVEDIYPFLEKMNDIDKTIYLNYVDTVSSKFWIEKLIKAIES